MSTHVAEKRPLGALGRMGLVAGVHLAALYLIATGLGIVPPLVQEPVIGTKLIEEIRPWVDPPPPPRPRMTVPALTVPLPDQPPIDNGERADRIYAQTTDDPLSIHEINPPATGPVLMGVRQDSRHPLSQPAYPAIDVRQGNEGSVDLEVYVLPSGRIGEVRVLRSAGSRTLDQSAIDEAKKRWRLQPATRDGVPYGQWHKLRVVFDLKDR